MAEGVQSPQWSQWLRGLRGEAPSVEELLLDERRWAAMQARAAREKEEERLEAEVEGLKLALESPDAAGGRRRILGGVGVVGERLAAGNSVSGGAEVPVTVEKAQARVHSPNRNTRAERNTPL